MAASTFSREIIDEEFWDDYEKFVSRILLIPVPTLMYAGLGIIEESLEFFESIKNRPYSLDNVEEGGDILYYIILLHMIRPHIFINMAPQGRPLENSDELIFKTARFSKYLSHFAHGRKGSDDFDKEAGEFMNRLLELIRNYCARPLVEVAKENIKKLTSRWSLTPAAL
jgi:hypothetical protein